MALRLLKSEVRAPLPNAERRNADTLDPWRQNLGVSRDRGTRAAQSAVGVDCGQRFDGVELYIK